MCAHKKDGCAECKQSRVLSMAGWTAFGAWLFFLCIAGAFWAAGRSEVFGQFGDAFGVINALFSSLAVAGAIYAVVLQQEELKLTREEMRQARAAHEQSANAQDELAELQAASTMLSSLLHEMDFLQRRHTAAHELWVQVKSFRSEYPDEILRKRVHAHVLKDAMKLFSEGEKADFIKVEPLPPPNEREDYVTSRIERLESELKNTMDSLSQNRIRLSKRRRIVSQRITRSMGWAEDGSDGGAIG